VTAGAPVVWVVAGADTARRWVRVLRREGLTAGALAWSEARALGWGGWPDPVPEVVLLTSPHALLALPEGAGGGVSAACVGAATARAAQARGFRPICVGEEGGASLARDLLAVRPGLSNVLFLAGRGARREAVDVLQRAGVRVEAVQVYAMEAREDLVERLGGAPEPDAVVLGSPRAAQALHRAMARAGRSLAETTFCVVLGAVTEKRAESLFHRYVAVASRTDAQGLAATVRDVWQARNTDGHTR
jgi:uroporphyrinogen-III synthase